MGMLVYGRKAGMPFDKPEVSRESGDKATGDTADVVPEPSIAKPEEPIVPDAPAAEPVSVGAVEAPKASGNDIVDAGQGSGNVGT